MDKKSSTTEVKSLVVLLAEVMDAVGRVEKRGFNKFFNYKYAMEADVLDAVREELAKRSVMLIPSVEKLEWRKVATKQGEQDVATLWVKFRFMGAGEVIELVVVGEGMDSTDKAIYKAITGAEKYVLMKTFLIATGTDPHPEQHHDASPPQDEPPPFDDDAQPAQTAAKNEGVAGEKISPAQGKRLWAIAYKRAEQKDYTAEEIVRASLKLLNLEHTNDIPWRLYEKACLEVQNFPKKNGQQVETPFV